MSTPEQILKEAVLNGTPVIEDGCAWFVWRGDMAPDLIGDWTDWERGTPARLEKAADRLWLYRLALPSDAYIEYIYIDSKKRRSDPLNKRRISNGMGKENHFFGMPEYAPSAAAKLDSTVPAGTITQYKLPTLNYLLGKERNVHLYQPAADGPYPLLLVYDGDDYIKRVSSAVILDNLVASGQIKPLAAAFISNGGRARTMEYSASDATIDFLLGSLLPFAQQKMDILDYRLNPGAFGVLGASMGGLMSLYTGLRLPDIFGYVLAQSGAFCSEYADHSVFNLVRYSPLIKLKIWMEIGKYDFPILLDSNRKMERLLQRKGYPVKYHEYNGGHNYSCWRDGLTNGLKFAFPGIV